MNNQSAGKNFQLSNTSVKTNGQQTNAVEVPGERIMLKGYRMMTKTVCQNGADAAVGATANNIKTETIQSNNLNNSNKIWSSTTPSRPSTLFNDLTNFSAARQSANSKEEFKPFSSSILNSGLDSKTNIFGSKTPQAPPNLSELFYGEKKIQTTATSNNKKSLQSVLIDCTQQSGNNSSQTNQMTFNFGVKSEPENQRKSLLTTQQIKFELPSQLTSSQPFVFGQQQQEEIAVVAGKQTRSSNQLEQAFVESVFKNWLDYVCSLTDVKYSSAKYLLEKFALALNFSKPEVRSMSSFFFDRKLYMAEIKCNNFSAVSVLRQSLAEAEQEAAIEVFRKIYEHLNASQNDIRRLVEKVEELSVKKSTASTTTNNTIDQVLTPNNNPSTNSSGALSIGAQFKNLRLLESLKSLDCPQCESTVKLEEWTSHAKQCLAEKKKFLSDCLSCPVCYKTLSVQSSRVFPCGHAICELCLNEMLKSKTSRVNDPYFVRDFLLHCCVCRKETKYDRILKLI